MSLDGPALKTGQIVTPLEKFTIFQAVKTYPFMYIGKANQAKVSPLFHCQRTPNDCETGSKAVLGRGQIVQPDVGLVSHVTLDRHTKASIFIIVNLADMY